MILVCFLQKLKFTKVQECIFYILIKIPSSEWERNGVFVYLLHFNKRAAPVHAFVKTKASLVRGLLRLNNVPKLGLEP